MTYKKYAIFVNPIESMLSAIKYLLMLRQIENPGLMRSRHLRFRYILTLRT